MLLTAALSAPCAALAAPEKGMPPLTQQTQQSGGPIDPRQAALRFDAVDLAIEVLPAREAISAVATLDFTAREPVEALVIDLDRNLPVSAIQIDGQSLAKGAWTNPEGKLVIALPHALAAGEHVKARISYAGTPHVAVRAPWDDGFVWAKTPSGAPWIASTAEGYGCDLFWPCLDFPTGEPAKATLHITVPKGLKVPSNGVLTGVDTLADGRTTVGWLCGAANTRRPRMPTTWVYLDTRHILIRTRLTYDKISHTGTHVASNAHQSQFLRDDVRIFRKHELL